MSLIENLKRDYGDFLIDIPRWEIPDQGISALIGPSGSGKTSCFRLLLGLEPCPGLSWKFSGENIMELPVSERRMGVVFQDLHLFSHMSAIENILFAGRARNIESLSTKANKLLSSLRLEKIKDKKVKWLSGGEKQRVALGRALIGEPRFLFLDEPFSALDAHLKSEARNLVKELITDNNVPTLLITHDEEDVEALASHRFYIEDGKLVG